MKTTIKPAKAAAYAVVLLATAGAVHLCWLAFGWAVRYWCGCPG